MEEEVLPTPLSDQFLANISNQENYWTFQLMGRRTVTGKVVNFLWNTEGVPITLKIKPDNHKPVEILWVNILTITQGKV